MHNHNEEVREYFAKKADAYDDVDDQLYWVLSDRFYKEVLRREVPRYLAGRDHIELLDAGAGTGRWTLFFHELFSEKYDINGLLLDLSPEMLKVAAKKLEERGLGNRFRCRVADIEAISDVQSNAYDASLSFYNVISFVENPRQALSEIHNKLKEEGIHLAVVANTYHAYYFSILTNRMRDLEMVARDSKIRFNDQMPPIHCFTPQQLKELYLSVGFRKVDVIGGPSFIYPGMDETFLHGQTDALKNKLSTEDVMDAILDLELKHYKDEGIASRANTLLVIAQK